MNEKEKRKQVAKISVFITSIFVIFLSISYAFINQTLVGTKKQVITAGNLQLNLTEGDSVTLENALPMYDEVGMTQKPFTFSIANTTATPTNYVLKLVDVTPEERDKLDTSIVKYGLEKNGVSTIQKLSDLTNGILEQGKIGGNETIDYTLRLWIDSSVEDETLIKNKSLSYRIQVEAGQEIEVSYKGMMKARELEFMGGGITIPSETGVYSYSAQITHVIFENKINIPKEAPDDKQWDISEKEDGSVMAYLEEIGTLENGNIAYTLHIQANDKIIANSNSSTLFSGFYNLYSIDGFEYFDVSNVQMFGTNIYGGFSIFSHCPKLSLDLSKLDTSNVTNMSYMFTDYSSSQPLDLSNFNTSNVTDMSHMFSNYSSSQPLDLSNFNTSNVADMSYMFYNWESEASLDISNFDISKVTSKDKMFGWYSTSYASPILVKDEAMKAWVLEQNPYLTGVAIKNQ